MEKVRPWCGQPSDRGRTAKKTEQNTCTSQHAQACKNPNRPITHFTEIFLICTTGKNLKSLITNLTAQYRETYTYDSF